MTSLKNLNCLSSKEFRFLRISTNWALKGRNFSLRILLTRKVSLTLLSVSISSICCLPGVVKRIQDFNIFLKIFSSNCYDKKSWVKVFLFCLFWLCDRFPSGEKLLWRNCYLIIFFLWSWALLIHGDIHLIPNSSLFVPLSNSINLSPPGATTDSLRLST